MMGPVSCVGEIPLVVLDDVLSVAMLAGNAPNKAGQIVYDTPGDLAR
jgi:hypothetical protein